MLYERILLDEERGVSLTVMAQEVGGEYRGIDARPAVLILPGGGYMFCSDREAEPVALPYLKAGFQAFILRYGVLENAAWPKPLEDYERAMSLIRENAEEWHVIPDKIAVIGFSAGGHLAGAAATMSENRPNAAILGYAVLIEETAGELGLEMPNIVAHVDEKTCPCFLFATRTDSVVPIRNTLEMLSALERFHTSFETHIYAYGPHGFSTGDHAIQDADTAIPARASDWVADSIAWLRELFGDFGRDGLTAPLIRAHVNNDGEAWLSLDCTVSRFFGNPETKRSLLAEIPWDGGELVLFENPYVPEALIEAYEKGLPEAHIALCRRAAEESMVLLKNEGGVPPLDRKRRISLVGTLADNAEEVCGAWAMAWKKEDCVSIRAGLEAAGANFGYYPCGGPEGEIDFDEAERACREGDVIVAVVGETDAMSGEASSRADISLPGGQRALLEKLLASGKPVVAVLMNGRPLALGWEAAHIPAILEAWHLGIRMGDAVAAALLGDVNPSGKLASSFPAVTGQCPVYYNHPSTGRPGSKSKFTSRYLDAPWDSLYPFGHGLSYTRFAYDALTVTEGEEALEISVRLQNTGAREGTEVAQLYMQDVAASLVRPVKELKDYRRVTLAPGEERELRFTLPKQELGFYDNAGQYRLEDGLFRVYVGTSSRDCLTAELRLRF